MLPLIEAAKQAGRQNVNDGNMSAETLAKEAGEIEEYHLFFPRLHEIGLLSRKSLWQEGGAGLT